MTDEPTPTEPSTDPWWLVNAGTPDGMEGEREGAIQAPDEETARSRYLAGRPAGWVIKTISPGAAPSEIIGSAFAALETEAAQLATEGSSE